MKKRLLFISTIFPSPINTNQASFSMQQISALKEYFDIDVITPIPWYLKLSKQIPFKNSINEIITHNPPYYYTSRILRSYYGHFYYASIKNCAYRLIQEKKHDIIYSSWLYPDGWASAKIARKFGMPLFIWAIGTDANRLKKNSAIADKTLAAIDYSNKTICASNALRDKLVSIGGSSDKLIVLYNGVNREIFHEMDKNIIRNQLGLMATDKLILFVGNLLITKGLNELIDAFNTISKCSQVKDIKLILAGSGPYESALKGKISAAGLSEQVIFKGSCTLPVVAKLMNAVDVVCLPSHTEGLPNVVLEALCCNAKVVATDVGGIPELRHHKNLYLVPSQNSIKLADMLERVLDSKYYEDSLDDIFSWKEHARKLAEILQYGSK